MTTTKPVVTVDAMEELLYRLTRFVKTGNETRTFLAEKFTKSLMDAEYEIRWLSGRYEAILLAAHATEVLELLQTQKATTQQIEQHFRDEFDRWYPENSTSPFSNACHNEKHAVLKKMIETFERFHYQFQRDQS